MVSAAAGSGSVASGSAGMSGCGATNAGGASRSGVRNARTGATGAAVGTANAEGASPADASSAGSPELSIAVGSAAGVGVARGVVGTEVRRGVGGDAATVGAPGHDAEGLGAGIGLLAAVGDSVAGVGVAAGLAAATARIASASVIEERIGDRIFEPGADDAGIDRQPSSRGASDPPTMTVARRGRFGPRCARARPPASGWARSRSRRARVGSSPSTDRRRGSCSARGPG